MTARQPSRDADEIRRARREGVRRPRREPLRIVVATDPSRPVRTIVIPRTLPAVAVAVAVCLVMGVTVLGLTSWRMSDVVRELKDRLGAMNRAADELARHPLSADVRGAGTGPDLDQLREGRRTRTPSGREGRFTVQAVNTGEEVEVVFDAATGEADERSYLALRRLMRCLRSGAENPIDPRLIQLLHLIAERTGQKVQLVSGFRARIFSNADLSYHARGMAADVRIAGMTPLMVRDLASSLGIKGVGYYPVSQFVHIDVREQRYHWTDHSHKRMDDDEEGGIEGQ